MSKLDYYTELNLPIDEDKDKKQKYSLIGYVDQLNEKKYKGNCY